MTARAYLRTDPAMFRRKVVEQGYSPALFSAFQAVICLAEEQPDRGRFRSERLLKLLLDEPKDGVRLRWGRHVKSLIQHGDLVRLADGTLYVDGWDEWQEGDVTVRERMQRLRDRKKRDAGSDETDRNHRDDGQRNASTGATVTVPSRVRDPRALSGGGSRSGSNPPNPAERGSDEDHDDGEGFDGPEPTPRELRMNPRANGTNPRAVAAREAERRRDVANTLQMRYLRGELSEEQHRAARLEAGLT